MKSETGEVTILLGEEFVCSYSTSPDASIEVKMILLKPKYYCWWVGGAKAKYIKRPEVSAWTCSALTRICPYDVRTDLKGDQHIWLLYV